MLGFPPTTELGGRGSCSDCAPIAGYFLQSGGGSCDLKEMPDCGFVDWRGFGDFGGEIGVPVLDPAFCR